MKVRFLADANFDQDVVAGMLRRERSIDFALPQNLIPRGMTDPDVLQVAAMTDRILVTHDVRTMPQHFAQFVARRSSPGAILVPKKMPIGQVIDELILIWEASEPEEWINLMRRLPL